MVSASRWASRASSSVPPPGGRPGCARNSRTAVRSGRSSSTIVSQCSQSRSLSRVATVASPTAPPRLRISVNRPLAFFTCSGGMVPSARLVMGMKAQIMPIPRSTCGSTNWAWPQSAVMWPLSQEPVAASTTPVAITRRGSVRRAMRPTSGAVKNIATPWIIITSPICSES